MYQPSWLLSSHSGFDTVLESSYHLTMKHAVSLSIIFLCLLLFAGCTRRQEAATSGEEPGKMPVPPKTETSVPPQRRPDKTQPAERSPQEDVSRAGTAVTDVTDPAFFARRDRRGPGWEGVPAMDYELGVLSVDVPSVILTFLQDLGDHFSEDAVSPAWRDNLARQFLLFPAGTHGVSVGSIEEKDGKILAPFKIIRDNQLILGSLWAEQNQEGQYRIQDITLDQSFSAPFDPMDFPISAVTAFPGR